MKIKKLDLINFQGHKNSSVGFDPGVNVITGSSDSGKSSLIRAIVWVLTNRPKGAEFRSWSALVNEPVSVVMTFDDGVEIKRTKSRDENSYSVGDRKFDMVKLDLPAEVERAAFISKNNVQTQHDKYFLFQDSPGEAAKRLNELVGIDLIDLAMKRINAMARECDDEVMRKSIEIDDTEAQLKLLPNLEDVCGLLVLAEANEKELAGCADRISRISSLISSLEDYAAKLADLCGADETLALYDEMRSVDVELKGVEAERGLLQHLVAEYRESSAALGRLEDLMRRSKQELLALLAEAGSCPICGADISGSNSEEVMRHMDETFANS